MKTYDELIKTLELGNKSCFGVEVFDDQKLYGLRDWCDRNDINFVLVDAAPMVKENLLYLRRVVDFYGGSFHTPVYFPIPNDEYSKEKRNLVYIKGIGTGPKDLKDTMELIDKDGFGFIGEINTVGHSFSDDYHDWMSSSPEILKSIYVYEKEVTNE